MNIINNDQKVLVYDFGTSAIKFGYGGDIRPLFSIPPYSAQRNQEDELDIKFGEEWLQKDLSGVEVLPMFDQEGNIMNREKIITFLDWTYDTCFGEIDPQQWNVLFSQPSSLLLQPTNFRNRRALLAELSFEFGNHPQLSFQHDSTLACYSHEIHTGVVVDFGWSNLRVVPVLEGHPLRNSIKILNLGGFEITNILEASMEANGKKIRTFLDKKSSDGFEEFFSHQTVSEPSQSQINFCRRGVLIDMVKNLLRFKTQPDPSEKIADYVYYMPGREPVEIQDEIEVLSSKFWEDSEDHPSLQTLIEMSISSLPFELQSSMWTNIITCGGLSKLRGFNEVLESKLNELAPKGIKPKVIEPPSPEASSAFSVWVGGSIVASYEKFPDLCISSKEWSESGERILDLKCL